MDRNDWLAERRAAVRAQYDEEAPDYTDDFYPVPLHAAFIERLLAGTPPGGVVLDAPCGTGRWFGQVAASGRRVVGVDQSAGMLEQARARAVAESLHEVGLQELPFEAEFDAAMTVDAMENIPPEDWPLVLANLRRALRPGALLYLTVEELNESDIADAAAKQSAQGLPTVLGEVVEGDTAGYHYYPGREQVLAWLAEGGFTVVDENLDWQDDWGYRHLLARVPSASAVDAAGS